MIMRQTNDIKAFIVALQHDSHVDHTKIGVVGGSAGGTHAVVMALDTTESDGWPYWSKDVRPQCVVALSGIYDFSDRTPPPGLSQITQDFILGTETYAHTGDLATLKSLSPVSLVTTPTDEVPFVPMFLINSWWDSPPSYHQIVDMICALKSAHVPDNAYQTLTVPDTGDHSFAYWDDPDGQPGSSNTVGVDVINFLDAHLK